MSVYIKKYRFKEYCKFGENMKNVNWRYGDSLMLVRKKLNGNSLMLVLKAENQKNGSSESNPGESNPTNPGEVESSVACRFSFGRLRFDVLRFEFRVI